MYTTPHTRIRKIFTVTSLVGIVLFLCFMVVGLPAAHAQERDIVSEADLNPPIPIPISKGPVQQINPYFSTQTITYSDGTNIDRNIINGPPKPPPGYELERAPVALPEPNPETATNTLTAPAFNWVFGCSSVSGAMIAGYYDRNGYPNMYTGPTNGSVMPLDNSSWPTWVDSNGDTYPNLPLAASHNGVDGRAIRGSIDDYWILYGSSANDPYITGSWTQHTWGTAIGDYMKTSQSAYGNTDGSTQFYTWTTSSAQLTCSDMVSNAIETVDGTYGRKLFYEARGYTVTDCYNQKTDNNGGGFTFAMYKAQIDAGRPVMLNLAGHTIAGVGYNDTGNTVYLHDTWDYLNHSMAWGGSYSGMQLLSVSIVNLTPAGVTPPTVTTGSATDVTSSSATLNGTVNANGASTTVTFQYGLTTSYGSTVTADQSPVTGSSNTSVSKAITGLTPNTTYHYRVVGVNSGGTTNGSDMTFKTYKSTFRVLYDNGPLVNSSGTGAGGADESVLQQSSLGMNVYGFGNQVSAGYRIADNFALTTRARLLKIKFYTYQTSSALTSPITAVNLRIWNGPPNNGASTVIYGDTTTNRMTETAWSNIYRVTDTAHGNTSRPIMVTTVIVDVTLNPGTYWLDWQTDGSASLSGPFAPPITINGQTTTGNALQYTASWAAVLDVGPQGFPFIIQGEVVAAITPILMLLLN